MDEKINTTKDLKDILSTIDSINSAFTYDVWIPSLNKNVSFKELNTAQQKRLVKTIVDSPVYNTQFILALRDIITENCVEKIDISKLTLVDKFFIALKIRSVSVGDTIEIEFDKNNRRGFSIERILSDGITNYKNIEDTIITEGAYSITCGVPTIQTEYALEKELRDTNTLIQDLEIKTTDELRKTIGDVFIGELVKYISLISIIKDDKRIDINFNDINFRNRMAIIERLPMKIIDKIIEFINTVKTEINKIILFKTTIKIENENKELIEKEVEERLTLNGNFFIKS